MSRLKVGDIVKSRNNPITIYKIIDIKGFFFKKVNVLSVDSNFIYEDFKYSLFYKV